MAGLLQLVCASANPHKAAELKLLLDGVVELLPRPPGLADVDEAADDLLGNARLKAQAVCVAARSPALSDDTGLEVDALGGRPGVRSARYAGAHASYGDNVEKLLRELAEAGAKSVEERRARFRSVVVVVWPDGTELAAEGVVEGWIAMNPRGSEGFGYDNVFVPNEGYGRTFAEMGDDKHSLSHRRRALLALAKKLQLETHPS